MRTDKWIAELKPEDTVIVHHTGYSKRRSIGRVIKTSKTGRITVLIPGSSGEYTFLPSGWQRGGGAYHKARIEPYTHEEAEKIKDENERETIAGKLGAKSWRDWQEMPLTVLREVWKLITAQEGKEKSV